MNRKLTRVSSKWFKTKIVLNDEKLAGHIPATRKFTRSRLLAMLERYAMLYVKPDTGSRGIGVIRVEKKGGLYRYQSGVRAYKFSTFPAFYQSLKSRIGKRRYLIQKGIHVLRYEGRPFDFRVMIQKNPARRWECTGTAARVAHPHKAVTNGSQGGTIFSPADLLHPLAGTNKTAALLKQMNTIAHRTAKQFSRHFPAMNELGLDIAIDRSMKPWILEVNTHPDPCPFTKLTDKRNIRKIVAYGKAYGRRYRLTCSKAKKAPKLNSKK
ncbi:YheC/YheD family protein [Paenibacillus sp. SI8]|uniref:YheC/YheD family protein n=1 Tax=unclassified Paenibacillus TaxID=185978 RepID=UPI0034651962